MAIIQASRPLFERCDQFFKEFYYFTNHAGYKNIQLSKLFNVLNPCLGQLEYLGFHFPEYYPEKFFDDLQWPALPNLLQLHLSKIKIPRDAIPVLVKGFDSFPNMELLNLHRCDMDATKLEHETSSSHVLAENLPKLKRLNWISVVGNRVNCSGIRQLVDAIATMNSIHKVCLEGNRSDGETIEYCLERLKDLPQLQCISFTNPYCNFEASAKANVLKWNILRPFQLPFAFPAIQQLRLLDCGDCHLYDRNHKSLEREKFELAICQGIKQFKPHCSVEF